MPFHSKPRLKVEIQSQAGKLSFKRSKTNIVSYSADEGSDARTPKVLSVQRLNTGEALDSEAWHLNEIKGELAKCIPDIRLFEVVFEGKEYTQRLNKCDGRSAPVLNLYRSITSEDTVRFMVAVGETVISPLDVELSYRTEQPKSEDAKASGK